MAEEAKIKNVQYYVEDFTLMNREKIPGEFDVIIAHMTPAVMKMEDFDLMRKLADKKNTFFSSQTNTKERADRRPTDEANGC